MKRPAVVLDRLRRSAGTVRSKTRRRRRLDGALRDAVAGYKPLQVDKALALIAAGGLVPVNRPGFYSAMSSDGTVTYLVSRDSCTCPAGQHARRCYHRAGAALLEAHRSAA